MNVKEVRSYLNKLEARATSAEFLDLAKRLALKQRPAIRELARLYPDAKGGTAIGTDSSSFQYLSELTDQDLPVIILNVHGTDINDDELKHVVKLSTLVKLGMNRCKSITDKGMRLLTRLPFLDELRLWECRITDKGLARLAKAPMLRMLWLDHCINITPKGVAKLAAISTLKGVSLSDTLSFHEAAIEALRPKLPGCKIYWVKPNVWVPKQSKM